MWREKYLSITELRQNATKCIHDLASTKEKIIFINNKPQAVLVDFNQYEKMKELLYIQVWTLDINQINDDMVHEAKKVKDLDDSEFINIK